ncbi:unnamed protein product [Caenorhabditis angaria]|uniref:Uncharacterized protein n=1 Tax=Caenorhabditis angaria TaxID=860376 RepID=A0A9P1IFC4_9PELO|nr:unnamed protein product [Caenorhabditis angaria]
MAGSLRSIELTNDVFIKQVAILQQKLQELSIFSKLCNSSKAHYQKLKGDTSQKSSRYRIEIENVAKEIKDLIDSSTSEIKILIEKLEEYEKHDLEEVETLNLQKLFDFPYDEKIAKMTKENEEYEKSLEAESEKEKLLEEEIDVLNRDYDVKSREVQKAREELRELDELVIAKREEIQKRNVDSQLANEEKVGNLRKYVEELERDNIAQQAEIENSLKEQAELDSQIVELGKQESEKIKTLEEINKLLAEVEKIEDFSEEDRELFKDNLELFEEFLNVEQEIEKDPEIVQLRKEIEALKESRVELEKEVSESLEVKTRHDNVLAEFDLLNEEVEALNLKLEEYQLKVDEQESMKRQNSANFRTPELVKKSKSLKKSLTLTTDSGFQHISNDPISYPGIQRITSSLKRKLETEALKNDSIIDSFQSSIDNNSLLLSSESGTTADGSLMGGMFSPLKNPPILKQEDEKKEDFEEFSMMDHFKQYTTGGNTRGKRARKSEGLAENQNQPSKSSDDTMIVSNEEDEILEIEKPQENFDDIDDSLAANESELDQSIWTGDY